MIRKKIVGKLELYIIDDNPDFKDGLISCGNNPFFRREIAQENIPMYENSTILLNKIKKYRDQYTNNEIGFYFSKEPITKHSIEENIHLSLMKNYNNGTKPLDKVIPYIENGRIDWWFQYIKTFGFYIALIRGDYLGQSTNLEVGDIIDIDVENPKLVEVLI